MALVMLEIASGFGLHDCWFGRLGHAYFPRLAPGLSANPVQGRPPERFADIGFGIHDPRLERDQRRVMADEMGEGVVEFSRLRRAGAGQHFDAGFA